MKERKIKTLQVGLSTLMLLNTLPVEVLASEVVGMTTKKYAVKYLSGK